MTWNPMFRSFGKAGGPPYRPAWVCDTCLKHDYVLGVDEEEKRSHQELL